MAASPLVTAAQLQTLQRTHAPLLVFDCSYDLMQPQLGELAYLQGHIPGALYADLGTALSAHGSQALAQAASGGRHPLPSREHFAQWLGQMGLTPGMQVVVYDRNGCNYCGRLWWMLQWMGHGAVAVLDGGLQAWQAAGGALAQGHETPLSQTNYAPAGELLGLVATNTVAKNLGRPHQTLIDARAPARFAGTLEPLDPVAGHIPGALNRPFAHNFTPDGHFKPAAVLRAEFDALLAGRDPATVVHHCGSGVSAVPNLLAMQIAGFAPTALYAGSWSEWSRTPGLPVAQSGA